MITTIYPSITERPVTREQYDRLWAIVAAFTTDDAVYYYIDALRVCRFCGSTEEEGHRDGCPVGAAKALDA